MKNRSIDRVVGLTCILYHEYGVLLSVRKGYGYQFGGFGVKKTCPICKALYYSFEFMANPVAETVMKHESLVREHAKSVFVGCAQCKHEND